MFPTCRPLPHHQLLRVRCLTIPGLQRIISKPRSYLGRKYRSRLAPRCFVLIEALKILLPVYSTRPTTLLENYVDRQGPAYLVHPEIDQYSHYSSCKIPGHVHPQWHLGNVFIIYRGQCNVPDPKRSPNNHPARNHAASTHFTYINNLILSLPCCSGIQPY